MDTKNQERRNEQQDIDLKALREAKGLTLKDIARETRISLSVLEAIEGKRFQQLPEPVYTRAFIKSYAGAAQIDQHDILSLYDSYVEDIESKLREAADETRTQTSSSRKRVITSLLIGVVVLAAIFFFLLKSGPDVEKTAGVPSETPAPSEIEPSELKAPETTIETPSAEEDIQAPPPAPATQSEPSASVREEPAEEAPPEAALPAAREEALPAQETPAVEVQAVGETREEARKEPYVLALEGTELSWLKITEDANEPYEVLLRPGQKITRTAT